MQAFFSSLSMLSVSVALRHMKEISIQSSILNQKQCGEDISFEQPDCTDVVVGCSFVSREDCSNWRRIEYS